MDDFSPAYMKRVFACPHCSGIGAQVWTTHVFFSDSQDSDGNPAFTDWEDIKLATCGACGDYSIWLKKKEARISLGSLAALTRGDQDPQGAAPTVTVWEMIWPKRSNAELPHKDMPEDLVGLYQEARAVFNDSPRSSAALLRLLTEMLLQKFTDKDTIHNMIGALMKEGLDFRLQRAADILRLAGNDAVHPAPESDDEGDPAERVGKMFRLVNKLVQDLITSPTEIDDLYEALPLGKREAIEKRDGGTA